MTIERIHELMTKFDEERLNFSEFAEIFDAGTAAGLDAKEMTATDILKELEALEGKL